ncbi:MAG: DUF58 domain-containing protein [Chloroflexota bacterium]|nr:DUF58 domain-containing protein [Chloroflexota bacterium]
MLGGAWLFITFVLLLVAIILRQAPLLLVALLFFFASGAARLWARYALERVEYGRRLSANRVFFGESVTLEVAIANRKILPLPWVHVQDEVPEGVTFLKGQTSPSHKPTRAILSNFLSLSWYHRQGRRYPLQCLRRGLFTFGPATIKSGDLFGFFFKDTTDERLDHLLVYPRVVPLEELGIPSKAPFGDLLVRRHLFQDPVRVMTTRDYAYGDPLKRIAWKATARVGRLQSRVFEPTTTVDLALFLDTRTVAPPFWGQVEQLLETGIIVAASVANHSIQEGYRVGLYVNELYRHASGMVRLPPSDHPDQFRRVLEALAQLQGFPFVDIEELLEREARALPWASAIVVVAAAPTAPLLGSLHRLQRAGRRVALVLVGQSAAAVPSNGLLVYHVSDQVYWRELESLRVGQPPARTGGQPRRRGTR